MHPDVWLCGATVAVSAVVGMYIATRREHFRTRVAMLSLLGAIITWTAGIALRQLVGDGPAARVVWLIYLAGALGVAPMWFALCLRLTQTPWLRNPVARFLSVGGPSLFFWSYVATDPLHGRVLGGVVPEPYTTLQAAGGWTGQATSFWSYLLVLGGVALYLRSAARFGSRKRWVRGAGVAVGGLLPVAVGLLDGFDLIPPHLNPRPFDIAISIVILFAVYWRVQLQETLPIARRDVIEHLTDGVVVVDTQGLILDANPAAAEMLQASLRELERRPIAELVVALSDDVAQPVMNRAISEVVRSDGPWVHNFHIRGADGGPTRFVENTTFVVRDRDGEAAGYFVVMRDQTERRRVERFLRQSQRLETVAGLAAGIAHEVNNPLAYVRSNLNHVRGMTDDLCRDEALAAAKSEALDELRLVVDECTEGVERIGRLIERMRRFSHLNDDGFEAVDMNQVVADALKMSQLHGSEAGVVEQDLAAGLPRVRGSSEHLVQAALNLLVNARQALAGHPDGRIRVETRATAHSVRLRIFDNGPGVPAEIRNRVFDPFFTTKEPGEGTGLGLAISYGIAREHGGTLELEPSATGTCLRLEVPVLERD